MRDDDFRFQGVKATGRKQHRGFFERDNGCVVEPHDDIPFLVILDFRSLRRLLISVHKSPSLAGAPAAIAAPVPAMATIPSVSVPAPPLLIEILPHGGGPTAAPARVPLLLLVLCSTIVVLGARFGSDCFFLGTARDHFVERLVHVIGTR